MIVNSSHSFSRQPLEMDYFEEAIDFLLDHPKVERSKGVGVCGISKGAEACLAMASTISESKLGAVAVLNTIIYHGVMPVHYKSKLVCDAYSFSINENTLKHVGPNTINMLGLFDQGKDLEEESAIPFGNCKMPILFVACEDDQVCPSVLHVSSYSTGRSNFLTLSRSHQVYLARRSNFFALNSSC